MVIDCERKREREREREREEIAENCSLEGEIWYGQLDEKTATFVFLRERERKLAVKRVR